MNEILILPLSRNPAALNQLAIWHHEQCLRQRLKSSLERRRAYLARHLGPEPIPLTLIAQTPSGQVLGCVSLVRYKSALAPGAVRLWLSNLYVDSSYRRQGLGNELMLNVLEQARQQKASEVWLFTDQQSDYYRARGWQDAGNAKLGGGSVNIMKIEIH